MLINWPFLNQRLDAVTEMLGDPNVVMGLADAGAHVGQIMDASQPTFFLSQWVRERGVMPDRGGRCGASPRTPPSCSASPTGACWRPGRSPTSTSSTSTAWPLHLPEYVHDFPGGAGRYTQRADGYRATVVNGRVALVDGDHTGDLAGVVLRSQ